jgi:hypothetical protein
LVNTLKPELPWVESMYDKLSGWVHFSENHIFTAISYGDGDRTIKVSVGSFREEIPETLFDEAKEALTNRGRFNFTVYTF